MKIESSTFCILAFCQLLTGEGISTNAIRMVELESRHLAEATFPYNPLTEGAIPNDLDIEIAKSTDEESETEITIKYIGDDSNFVHRSSYKRLADTLYRRCEYLSSLEARDVDITASNNDAIMPPQTWAENLANGIAEGSIERYQTLKKKGSVHNLSKGDTFPRTWLTKKIKDLEYFRNIPKNSVSDEATAFLAGLSEGRELWRFEDRAWTVASNHGWVIIEEGTYIDSLVHTETIGRINISNQSAHTTPASAPR